MEKQKQGAYDSERGIRREGLPLLSRMGLSFQGKTRTVLLRLQVDARFMDVARASRSCPAGSGRRRKEKTLPFVRKQHHSAGRDGCCGRRREYRRIRGGFKSGFRQHPEIRRVGIPVNGLPGTALGAATGHDRGFSGNDAASRWK